MYDSSRFNSLAGHSTRRRACVRPKLVVIPINLTLARSISSFGSAAAEAVWVCAICWLPGEVRIAALLRRMIIVMATVRKITPANNAFLFIYELKTHPQRKVSFETVWSVILKQRTILLLFTLCTETRTIDFGKWFWSSGFMAAGLRISIKDYHRNLNLKILLFRPPYPSHEYWKRVCFPKSGRLWENFDAARRERPVD